MRVRYCRTSWCDVTRPCSMAVRISAIVASTTVNGLRGVAGAALFVCARVPRAAVINKRAVAIDSPRMRGMLTPRRMEVTAGDGGRYNFNHDPITMADHDADRDGGGCDARL